MSAGLRAIFLITCLSVCAHAQARRLAVYSKNVQDLDRISTTALRQELQRLLIPAGVDVIWQAADKVVGGGEFELLVVGSLEGNCSVADLPASTPLRSRALGDSAVSSGGRVLPYFRVDCDHLVRTLLPALRPLNTTLRHVMLGRAIARVIAHEIYHFLSQATIHDSSGVAKASFSLADLIALRFDFDTEGLRRMEPLPRAIPVAAFPADQAKFR